jgi:hypothetical protein
LIHCQQRDVASEPPKSIAERRPLSSIEKTEQLASPLSPVAVATTRYPAASAVGTERT